MSETLQFGSRSVELSHPDKLLFPDDGITKRDLVEHYQAVAEVLLPHARDRALTLHRLPEGIEGEGFYQRARPDGLPDWVEDVEVERKSGGTLHQVRVSAASDLVALAQLEVLTLHAGLARVDDLDQPDRLIFDLDPPGKELDHAVVETVRAAARAVCAELLDAGLAPFLTTTGSRGFHVVVPIQRGPGFDAVRAAARELAEDLAARHPKLLTTAQRKADRGGRIYVDLMRNAYGQSAVLPYSVRALPGAPVATPLDWEELEETGPRDWTLRNIQRRLGQRDCPWKGLGRHAARFG